VKIAVIGSGGREHAILWRLARDSETHELFALPGNGGTDRIARTVATDASSVPLLMDELRRLKPDLVVVGPEIPLAAGLADSLQEAGMACFGPTARAARIESSKVFAKQLMQRYGIPTADFQVFSDYRQVEAFVQSEPEDPGWVVKADGLAAGKGAYVCNGTADTLATAHALLVEGILGDSGRTIVLERKLIGREVSALYWCDGENCLPLPAAQDYKRAQDRDQGPNTGGMGSYSPATHLTPALAKEVEARIIIPTLRAMAMEGSLYRGILYAGLMLTANGPEVIEFNCRFGDPETQTILPVWDGDFAGTLLTCATGTLKVPAQTPPLTRHAVCVVLAADGYPDRYRKSIPLTEMEDTDHAFTLHAGTARVNGQLVSTGGRVLNALGVGPTVKDARIRAYELAGRLLVAGLRYRTDIALQVESSYEQH
jgi:phosphoribosylamine--glycine ligase